MIEPGETLSSQDIERIADLHVASIDESIPTMLGGAFPRRFYEFLVESNLEWLFVERVECRVEAVCVVSFQPGSVYGRILRQTFPALARALIPALLRKAEFRAFLRDYAADVLRRPRQHSPFPEITYVFTSPEQRGKGLGRRLIRRVDAFLRERGVEDYSVKTLEDPANRALSFYDENGFRRTGRRVEAGRSFVVFQKPLDAS
jgi:ribosomal protein S18 acetylase RimI-like enzyme